MPTSAPTYMGPSLIFGVEVFKIFSFGSTIYPQTWMLPFLMIGIICDEILTSVSTSPFKLDCHVLAKPSLFAIILTNRKRESRLLQSTIFSRFNYFPKILPLAFKLQPWESCLPHLFGSLIVGPLKRESKCSSSNSQCFIWTIYQNGAIIKGKRKKDEKSWALLKPNCQRSGAFTQITELTKRRRKVIEIFSPLWTWNNTRSFTGLKIRQGIRRQLQSESIKWQPWTLHVSPPWLCDFPSLAPQTPELRHQTLFLTAAPDGEQHCHIYSALQISLFFKSEILAQL